VCSDETDSAAYSTSTCRSHEVTRFSAPTGLPAYQDAIEQGIGDVDAPGLRFGVTTPDVEQVGATS
jgi:hypothetical protein